MYVAMGVFAPLVSFSILYCWRIAAGCIVPSVHPARRVRRGGGPRLWQRRGALGGPRTGLEACCTGQRVFPLRVSRDTCYSTYIRRRTIFPIMSASIRYVTPLRTLCRLVFLFSRLSFKFYLRISM